MNDTISGVALYAYSTPLTSALQLGSRHYHVRQGFLVQLRTQAGLSALGEAAPLPHFSPETRDETAAALQQLTSELIGQQIDANTSLSRFTAQLACCSVASARMGVEMALLALFDTLAPKRGLSPLVSAPKTMPLLFLNEHIRLEAAVKRMPAPPRFKVKVGRQPIEQELPKLHRLIQQIPTSSQLCLDANRSWTLSAACHYLSQLPRERIAYIEEPLHNPAELPVFHEATGLPYALDESTQNLHYRFHPLPGLVQLVLKPTLCGGFLKVLQHAQEAKQHGVDSIISSSYESSYGLRWLARLAMHLNPHGFAGIDTHNALAHDVITPWPAHSQRPCHSLTQLEHQWTLPTV